MTRALILIFFLLVSTSYSVTPEHNGRTKLRIYNAQETRANLHLYFGGGKEGQVKFDQFYNVLYKKLVDIADADKGNNLDSSKKLTELKRDLKDFIEKEANALSKNPEELLNLLTQHMDFTKGKNSYFLDFAINDASRKMLAAWSRSTNKPLSFNALRELVFRKQQDAFTSEDGSSGGGAGGGKPIPILVAGPSNQLVEAGKIPIGEFEGVVKGLTESDSVIFDPIKQLFFKKPTANKKKTKSLGELLSRPSSFEN